MYRKYFKRVLDVILALILLILLTPILLLIFVYLKFSSDGNVFYYQQRPGLNCMPFILIKFRTMTDDKDEFGRLLPNKLRITKFGAFLRKYSLDELPQLINVLKGDLSLVGPRPLEMRYLPLYNEEQIRRHDVKPGITGWAQINGRNELSWEEKFKLDIWYVEHLSFLLDIKILILTLIKVFKSEGVNYDNENTVIPFDIYLKSKKSDL